MLVNNFSDLVIYANYPSGSSYTAYPYFNNEQGIRTQYRPLGLELLGQIMNSFTFVVGSGTREADKTDYTLESPITEITVDTISRVFSTNASPCKETVVATITYTGSTETTINEIGLVSDAAYIYGTTSHERLLFAREVLDSPITVNNGDTFSVSMVIG